MTAISQDFTIYAGNDVTPIFSLTNAAGTPIDISSVTEITWTAQRDLSSAAVLTKLKSTGGIVFVTDGTNGQFKVIISSGDTASLDDFYIHEATITDSSNKTSTVATGRLQVGRKPVWSYSGDPSTSTKDAIRFVLGDILVKDPLVNDNEIAYAYSAKGSVYGAAAMLCRSLSSQYARLVDTVDRELRTSYSSKSANFLRMAVQFEQQAAIVSGAMPYAGGISVADKNAQVSDADRVSPQFNIGMMDNLFMPVAPAGNETTAPSSNPTESAQ